MPPSPPAPDAEPVLSRRGFAALSVAAGLAGASAASASATGEVLESDVGMKTPDGLCDSALFRPARAGRWPGVVVFPDIFGLRPVFRDMGRRLAAEGYMVLVVNPFYRLGRAPIPPGVDINTPEGRSKVREALTPEAVMRDGVAAVAYLDGLDSVDKTAKIGAQGYCMGGAMTLQTAAAAPGRVGAIASFHGAGLATDRPDSPHLLAPRIKARLLAAIAESDDQADPGAKDRLRAAFEAAENPAQIEVYGGAKHGWTVADRPVYDRAAAERAWSELLALYKATLARS